MKKLPLGIQTFSELIMEDYLYVDKTEEICSLINSGKYFFVSRPRRFGKSILVSTLEEIFAGNRELFKGLYIYDRIEWEKYPVIKIDFSKITYSGSRELFIETFMEKLIETGNKYNISFSDRKSLKSVFDELIKKLSNINKVVILIDEYDKPIVDHITDREQAKSNIEVLREFYSVLKSCDKYLKFVFITGVSKFSKVSIFSGMNNLVDITLKRKFSSMLGITQEELLTNFRDYIHSLAEEEVLSEEDLVDKIKLWYDGYSWDGKVRLFNPHSILNLFLHSEFENYWFTSGTTAFLMDIIKKSAFNPANLEGVTLGSYVFDSYDIESMDINSLLFQTGYLTVKDINRKRRLYNLVCPNFEVKESLLNHLLGSFINENASVITPLYVKLIDSLEKDDIDEFMTVIRYIFAKIPYTLHMPAESYYHSLFYMILALMGVNLDMEVLTDKGRVDGVLEFDDKFYCIEFKYGKPGSDMSKLTEKAVKQIKEKKYYEKFLSEGKKVIFLGVAFIDKEIGYLIEKSF